ncbi:MAG: ABC transporter permease, partial [Bacteroidetes bacterium]
MFQNYLKTALRNMARYKGYTILNVSGLTIGLATCFLLFLWVKDELAYDRFHPGYDQIYRSQWKARFGENEWEIPLVPVPLAGTLEDVFPEVEHATQVYEGAMSLKKDGDFIREPNVLFVDDDFFRVFTVEPIAGNPATALKAPNTLLLTEETAHRYFGTSADVVGKTIRQNDGTVWQIGGIIKQWPEQSHLRFDFLAALQNLPHIERRKADWGSASCLTYFATKAGSDP